MCTGEIKCILQDAAISPRVVSTTFLKNNPSEVLKKIYVKNRLIEPDLEVSIYIPTYNKRAGARSKQN